MGESGLVAGGWLGAGLFTKVRQIRRVKRQLCQQQLDQSVGAQDCCASLACNCKKACKTAQSNTA